MPLARPRLWIATLALGAATAVAQPQAQRPAPSPPPAPTCTHCKEKLQTVDALRAALPSAWSVQLENEPVLGGQMLTVRAGPKDAPLLLLVHGLGQNGFTDWLPVLPQLARRYRVLAMDLPGFGYSAGPQGKFSPTNYARVLSQLLARETDRPVEVVGHSMGGAVALRLAAEQPQRVSRLVLVDVAGILQRTAFTKHTASVPISIEGVPEPLKGPVARLRNLGSALVERLFGLPGDPTGVLRGSDELWGWVLGDRTNVNAALALVDENFSAAIYTLPQPVQLIWGEADPVAPLRTGELLARRLPKAQLATLPGVGHVPMEQAPREFQTLLDRALQNPPAPRSEPPPATEPLQDLDCQGQVDRRYSGRYRHVRIDGCTAVRLVDVVADSIVVRNSIVQMTGVTVEGADVALDVTNSELVATACDFDGRTALRADFARLDLAGVRLSATGFAVQVAGRSRFVVSVSEIRDAFYTGWWHEDRALAGAVLDPRAPLRQPAPTAPPASAP